MRALALVLATVATWCTLAAGDRVSEPPTPAGVGAAASVQYIAEDDPRWDCAVHGGGTCGPGEPPAVACPAAALWCPKPGRHPNG